MRVSIVAFLFVLALSTAASAQPFNVRTWYAEGQVFVVWQFPAPPTDLTDTVEIYASPAPQVDTTLMNGVGRLFYPEYTGGRLDNLQPGSRLTVPTGGGNTYTLAVDEGVFVYTPRAAGNLFFAVVESGSTTVAPANSDTVAFNYDPVNEPIRAHHQFSGVTSQGNAYNAWVVWVEGRADHTDDRPDFPVLANPNRNGVPHVFATGEPLTPLPQGPLACVLALHGGGGNYQLFLPGATSDDSLGLQLTDGIVVAPDDSIFYQDESQLVNRTTIWVGYVEDLEPFDDMERTQPPDETLVVNYTQRRVFWILDWLESGINSPYVIDPERIAVIGHSGGARGTSHITRTSPERFCAVVEQNPGFNLNAASSEPDPLLGSLDQNLPTPLIGPNTTTIGVADLYQPTMRLSPTQRDLALTRAYFGKRDTSLSASWDAGMRAAIDEMNSSALGYVISWDEREHVIGDWVTEDPVLPGPDIAQWVAPVQSLRATGQYLVDTYRASASYPGFFDVDLDPQLPGRQPDPGDGDPDNGEPYGSWGGYLEWDTATLVDTADRWVCTLYATGLSPAAIDNCPVPELTASLAPRKPQAFLPAQGQGVHWMTRDAATDVPLQWGTTVAEAEGVTFIRDLTIPRDPERVRLVIRVCPSNFDDFIVCANGPAIAMSPGCEDQDYDGDGDGDQIDFGILQRCLNE